MKHIWIFLLLGGVTLAFTTIPAQGNGPSPKTKSRKLRSQHMEISNPAIKIEIKQPGKDKQPVEPMVTVVSGPPLTGKALKAILQRLPDLPQKVKTTPHSTIVPGPKPNPRPGTEIHRVFPPEERKVLRPDIPDVKDITVVQQFSPTGKVDLVNQVFISFSQPMIALQALDQIPEFPEISIVPMPDGKWRWLGVQTLVFESSTPFPGSTLYHINVGPGLQSVWNNPVEPMDFSFQTPLLKLNSSFHSTGKLELDPVLGILFSQRIRHEEIIKKLNVVIDGTAMAVVLATQEEIDGDPSAHSRNASWSKEHSIWFKPIQTLPKDALIRVTLPIGSWSDEGSLSSQSGFEFRYRTYAPLIFKEAKCGYRNRCTPNDSWTLEFNNTLNHESYDESSLIISPKIDQVKISGYGSRITINGLKKENQTYRLKIPSSIEDIYGQTLGRQKMVKFKTGPAPQAFYAAWDNQLNTLPSKQPAHLYIHSRNIDTFRVRIQRVDSTQYEAYLQLNNQRYDHDYDILGGMMPGEIVFDRDLKPSTSGGVDFTKIDLSPLLNKSGTGQFIVIAVPHDLEKESWKREMHSWIQVSDLGTHINNDRDQIIFRSYTTSTGQPLEGVTYTKLAKLRSVFIGHSNLLTLNKSEENIRAFDKVWSAKKGLDEVVMNLPYLESGRDDKAIWYLTTDRGMYKPGEDLNFKGILRWHVATPQGDLEIPQMAGNKISWKIKDARGNEIAKGMSPVNALGTFHASLTLPKEVELGRAYLVVNTAVVSSTQKKKAHAQDSHSFQIQEFRTPEFEVSTSVTSPGPYIQGQEIAWQTKASYYSGGGLAEAKTSWTIKARETSYRPPGWEKYSFGTQKRWWHWRHRPEVSSTETHSGYTDMEGVHELVTTFQNDHSPAPLSIVAEASVQDINNQTWSSNHSLLVHPSTQYVGLKLASTFMNIHESLKGEIIVTDVDGKLIPNQEITLKLMADKDLYNKSQDDAPTTPLFSKTLKSKSGPTSFQFTLKTQGRFKVILEVTDSKNRINRTELSIWVFGKQNSEFWDPDAEDMTLIPEKKRYEPGEIAKILLQAPFTNGWGTVALCRSGLLEEKNFLIEGGIARLEIPIRSEYFPNLILKFHVQETRDREASTLLKSSSGTLDLSISSTERTLTAEIKPAKPFMTPGAKSTLTVQVKDSSGKPVKGGEVLLMMVDEAVLALDGFALEDPISAFYPKRYARYQDFDSSSILFLETPPDPESLAGDQDDMDGEMQFSESMPAPMASRVMSKSKKATAPGGGAPQPIAVRSDFSALVFFSPTVRTDANGMAQVPFKLKDNLTRYRVMALVIDGKQRFGKSQANVTARLPLMVRPSAPRFLNIGDRFMLPITLQNQTDVDLPVEVLIRSQNLLFEQPGDQTTASQSVNVPANNRVLIQFPCQPETPGSAVFQVVATSIHPREHGEDAARISLPVLIPASAEAFATYGEIQGDDAHAYPIVKPRDVFPDLGGLQLQLSSTQLHTLTDAYLYLKTYPFECSEQLASKLISVVVLGDVLEAFQPDENPKETKAFLNDLVSRLAKNQLRSGGFSFWTNRGTEWPFLTLHVTHALVRADSAGVKVPKKVLKKALNAVGNIERVFPTFLSKSSRQDMKAYAYYVRALAGESVAKEASSLWKVHDVPLSREARSWLGSTMALCDTRDLASEILQSLLNEVIQTTSTAEFNKNADGDRYSCFWSYSRENALFLETLLNVEPKHALATNWVRGLLGNRTKGRWDNTQENIWNLIAIQKYLHVREKDVPDFSAHTWINELFAGKDVFKGRDGTWIHHTIPMSVLQEENQFLLQKEGAGRLYYRLGLDYTPLSLDLEPIEQGFSIIRSYEAIDDPNDVLQKEDGTWHIKAGAKVRVNIGFSQLSTRQHVALVDHLPAGFETLNPALKTSPSQPPSPQMKRIAWWSRTWFDHQNMRTDRTEAFSTRVSSGSRTYSYVARATTLGSFVVPPAKIEEMYQPETFGRTATDRVVIE